MSSLLIIIYFSILCKIIQTALWWKHVRQKRVQVCSRDFPQGSWVQGSNLADEIFSSWRGKRRMRSHMSIDPQQSSNILSVFSRFKDTKGLITIYYLVVLEKLSMGILVINNVEWSISVLCEILKLTGWTAFRSDVWRWCKLLERWKKIIPQCRKLERLLLAADPPEDGTEFDINIGELLQSIIFCCFYLLCSDRKKSKVMPYVISTGLIRPKKPEYLPGAGECVCDSHYFNPPGSSHH